MLAVLAATIASSQTSCGSDPPPPPPPPPTELVIRVVDGATGAPIAGAEVMLVEDGEVSTTDATGSVLKTLDPETDPGVHTYRAQAAGYVGAPRPGRPPLFVTLVEEQTITLDIALEPRPNASPGGALTGRVTLAGAPVKGAYVVAGATGFFGTLTDADGRYRIIGATQDFYTITAFVPGHRSTSRTSVEVTPGSTKEGLDLELTAITGGTVSGALTGGTGTSSIALVHPGTGELVPGLSTRATLPGAYTIRDVPPGRFVVAGGLELDGVTLDPDRVLTDGLPEVTITESASVSAPLALVEAIDGLSPSDGAAVTTSPELSWPAVPGADFYVVEVKNVGGQTVFGGFDTRGNPRNTVLAPMTSTMPDMPLVSGALYTWRVYAAEDVTTGRTFRLIGASEELGASFRAR
ncbi:carboxypeptidase-like regulatory domain-containing protein [Myxococcota bacterium]|nr:carboxypeptidase-like regulatory domain-containing protein [Myxococcota bacterium]